MHKIFNKTIAVLAVIIMVGAYFVPTGVYAANEIKQNSETKEENVKFNATINGAYETEADINSEAILELGLGVLEAGYLKDVKISLNNSNYSLGEVTDENVKYAENNELELNEVNSGEELNVKIPIKFTKNETVSEADFSKESEVKLHATYVNQKGKEKNIEKTLTEKLTWKTNSTETISQELNRYIKYENKSLVTFEMKDGVLDNTVPVASKEISVIVPKIENENPSKVIVTGNNIDYKYENGIVTIIKNMKNDEDKYIWNSEDAYTLTYIYDKQTNATSLLSSAQAKVTTINNETLEAATAINEFKVENELGSLVEVKIDGDTKLSKGYMHTTNKRTESKLDTAYKTTYKVNVGYAEVMDRIVVKEDSAIFENDNEETVKDAIDNLKTTKAKVDREQLVSILGKDGEVVVKDENDKVVGTLKEDVTETELNANKVTFEISKPSTEGTLNIETEKAIRGDAENSKEEIDSFKNLKTTINCTSFSGDQEVSDSNSTHAITLTDPTSKAKIDISTDRLSTIVKNENVIFNIVLSKKDIEDALFTNPTIKIKLPEQVTNIEMLAGNLLYENELQPNLSEVNGNEITIKLEGSQTEYNTSTTVDGALIRLETNLTLNNLAPSSKEKVQLECVNEYTGEVIAAEKEINVVAPTGFVTTNTIRVSEKEETAIENDAELIRLRTRESAKTMEIEANLVNNVDKDAEGLVVVGRIPTTGNKTIGGVELGTNINTKLIAPIELVNFDNATVYYSTNIEEEIEGTGWTTEASAESKSYKIVNNGTFENKRMATFKYLVEIPENLDYEKTARENYGVYYNNDAQNGITRNLVESKIAGITTGTAPDIKAEITAIDTNDGSAIDNGGNVREGEFITYKVQLTNTGNNDANDVNLSTVLPEELSFVETEEVTGETGTGYVINYKNKNFEQSLGTLKGGESRTIYLNTVVTKMLKSEEIANAELRFNLESDILEESLVKTHTTKITEGTINGKLSTFIDTSAVESEKYTYLLSLYNSNLKDKENVTATFKLPNGVKLASSNSNGDIQYNEAKNEVKVNYGRLQGGARGLLQITAVNNSKDSELKAYATLNCDGMNGEVRTNEVTSNNILNNDVIKATQTANISGEIVDADKIEYYIDINNSGKDELKLNIKDAIPDELRLTDYYVEINGQVVYSSHEASVNYSLTIPANQDARITIIAEPYLIENGQFAEITNKPIITKQDGKEISINEIKLRIKGTQEFEREDPREDTEVMTEETVSNVEVDNQVNKYRISGTAWYDENKNGKRDPEEAKLNGIKLTLYSAKTNVVAKDSKNNELQVVTNENGDYAFQDIVAGEYVVVSQYNSNDYEVTSYKEQGTRESADSDFTAVKKDGREVATTDMIKVVNGNIYGVDLGLKEKDKFDLDISNNISKITVISQENGRKEYTYDRNTAKVELSDEDVRNSTLLIEYSIDVRNNGNTEGYAKSIVNYIPEGLTFNSEYNRDWYLARDGKLYTTSLANKKIQPGESENIKLVLVKKVAEDNIGIIRGRAEINSTYNEKGLAEINALSSRKANASASDVIVAKKTKISALSTVLITLTLMTIFTIVLYQMKKYIDKEYNIED